MFGTDISARRGVTGGCAVRSVDRAWLESHGWRTTLEFRENHRRAASGRLLGVDAAWVVEAERATADDGVDVIHAKASTPTRAWARAARVARGGSRS